MDLLSHPEYVVHSYDNGDESTGSPARRRKVQLPLGTALIIPPQEEDYTPGMRPPPWKRRKKTKTSSSKAEEAPAKGETADSDSPKKKHWIVCLFTSWNFGRHVSTPDTILENTRWAVEDMKKQLAELRDDPARRPGELWSCRFNSGLFGVKWEETRKVLEESGFEITVVRPPGEE